MTETLFAERALTADGWRSDLYVTIDNDGFITETTDEKRSINQKVGVLLPAPSNVHSHSFQRAMAGLAEQRGPNAHDDFWTWRKVMYRFLEMLTPEDVEIIAAQMQMELLEAGYAAIAEFHYVHHQPNGAPFEQLDELSLRHFSAAATSGIGLTHLPVLYMQGGLDGRPLKGGQVRFGCSIDQFQELFAQIQTAMTSLPADYRLGVAPHSLRAVTIDGLRACLDLVENAPVHIHAAEQIGEVQEVRDVLGAPPIRWLLDNLPVDHHWCFIHATHMDNDEIDDLAASRAVAGLCPITEANLGDGIFNASRFLEKDGAIGLGADSNVKIALSEELRMLETSQRLRDKRRIVLSSEETPSNGRYLFERVARGGAQAIGRNAGAIEVGKLADLVALDYDDQTIAGLEGDTILDSWVFASDDKIVSDVWSAGRHMVKNGSHIHRETIEAAFTSTIKRLRAAL